MAVEYTEDQNIWPLMVAMKNCLCEEIEKSLPPVCFCEVMPGALAPFDFADDGMAWVRLANGSPSLQFPNPTLDARRSCGAPLAAELEIGIVRCAPRPSDARTPPSAEEEYEATRLQMADMAAMRRAVQCCFGTTNSILGLYTPIGPDEGGIGGTWQVYVTNG